MIIFPPEIESKRAIKNTQHFVRKRLYLRASTSEQFKDTFLKQKKWGFFLTEILTICLLSKLCHR